MVTLFTSCCMLISKALVNLVYSYIALFKIGPSEHRQKSIWTKIPELQQEINARETDFCFHFKVDV